MTRVGTTLLALWWREYRSIYSTRILVFSTLPRYVLQCGFFALLGGIHGGAEGTAYAYVGSACSVMMLATVVSVPDVLGIEKESGTLFRLRLSEIGVAYVACWRTVLHAGEGLIGTIASIVVVGIVFGLEPLALRMLWLLPLVVVMVVTSAAVGLVAAVLTTGRRADLLTANLLFYVILITSGAVAPVSDIPLLAAAGRLFPTTNGLTALRRALAGESFLAPLAVEVLVGGGWFLAALLLLRIQDQRSRSQSGDDYV